MCKSPKKLPFQPVNGNQAIGAGNAHVDANHAGVEVAAKLSGRVAATRKNRSSVAIFATSADRKRVIEIIGSNDRKHGAEDLPPSPVASSA